MKLARYVGSESAEVSPVEIVEEVVPSLPTGGLLVRTEACGLCSGELMAWYMEQKMPHVLGHEVCGTVIESDAPAIPVKSRVYVHHHAPCMECPFCRKGLYVHCQTWKKTHLDPGGMAEIFAVSPDLLKDTHIVNALRPEDAALAEPLACVMKSLRRSGFMPGQSAAVIGMGFMGLLHLYALFYRGKKDPGGSIIGYDIHPGRRDYARSLGFSVEDVKDARPADVVFVCPGVQSALDLAISIVNPGGTILLFSPFAPDQVATFDLNRLYFRDARLVSSYSSGPDDSAEALQLLKAGLVKAESVVSNFINLDEIPGAYLRMRNGEILKPMVLF